MRETHGGLPIVEEQSGTDLGTRRAAQAATCCAGAPSVFDAKFDAKIDKA